MPDTSTAIRSAYDAVAHLYADLFTDVLKSFPLERALLSAFAELVGPGARVADLGCGPGHLTAHLSALGLSAFGVDLSPTMISIARAANPDLEFTEGSMARLDLPDAGLAGILAFYSVIHTPPAELPPVLAEFHRVLEPGGHLMLGFFAGDDPEPQAFDHKVVTAYRWSPTTLLALLRASGFTDVAEVVREPQVGERFRQAQLLVRKPATP
ncbi:MULTISPECIES: class I SAM-dependent methyltransferase [Actinosynnema]|uniref:class I SAM-dependent DNA methyltransferase n=1 Tax=Actinosynnema TaxID=40566 RepID=UPI0020A524ED|nr:class I SAM-dependent methyltransferase [Actinosynnema pretiosum]MCP2097584.1 Ubiquinone/menaquinone biosynthesis C-methylase UbiE [Actinosynnema pretiosum]